MNVTQIYIGDSLLDLQSDTSVAISIKSIDIGTLDSRYVSYTNSIKSIWTENNQKLLGYSDSEKSYSNKPYRLNSGKVVQNGIEVIPNASLIIPNSTKKEFTLNIYDNLFNYFALIKGLDVTDVEPFADSAWNAAAIDSARTNTSGIVTVVINWGKSGAIYQVNYFLPCFYYHSLVRAVLEYTGLTLSGDILTDSRFTDLVIPYWGTDFAYPEDPYSQNSARVIGQTFIASVPGTPESTAVTFSSIVYGSNLISLSNNTYTVLRGINTPMIFDFSTYSTQDGSNTIFNIYVYRDGILANTIDVNLGQPPTISVNAGEVYTFIVEFDYGVSPVLEVRFNTVIDRTSVYWNLALSSNRFLCEDLVKDFFVRFAIVPKISGGTMYLKTLEAICSDRSGARDWSGKLLNTDSESISFGTNYAQQNFFEYPTNDIVNQPNLGQGVLEVDNETANVKKTIYKSVFENCITDDDNTGAYYVARIAVYDSTSTGIAPLAETPNIKLLTLKSRTTEGAITFNVSSRTDYKLGYFVDATKTKDTGFEYFLSQFYPSLENALQRNKIVTKFFLLDVTDIASYDPHKMIWDGENYYLINKITNFIPGEITKVELFKVS